MSINIIIRVDDISDKFDFYDLKKWFISNFPEIPICFYVQYSHYKYRWNKKSWNSIKNSILNHSWEIGGHSRTHAHLPTLSNSQLKQDIENNIQDIEKGLKSVYLDYKVTSFAYPYGEYDARVKQILEENGVKYGLTYPNNENYESQLAIPKEDLYVIGVSCNSKNSLNDWNERFENVYKNGDTYILCLHTQQWTKAQNRKNLKRLFKSKPIKGFYFSLKRLFKYLFKRSSKEMWNMLGQHLNNIKSFSDVQFITFKDLL